MLKDAFGRTIDYLRLSVTDRCDFRCIYCMAEDMTFLPRHEVLSLEELAKVGETFVDLGVDKIRVTGGEPLIRRDAIQLFQKLGKLPLKDLSLTTNGSQLQEFANPLADAGVTRINISLDSLQATRFKTLTRHGNLDTVLKGITSARNAGFQRIKINCVLMQNFNFDEVTSLARFALENELDISFIEEMPLGQVQSHARNAEYISSQDIRQTLEKHYTLTPDTFSTGGPSRYWKVAGFKAKIGFISPHSENFCASCNRVRVTASGRLLLCLGNENSLDLRHILRDPDSDIHVLKKSITQAIHHDKPEKHHFNLEEEPQIIRFMNATGG